MQVPLSNAPTARWWRWLIPGAVAVTLIALSTVLRSRLPVASYYYYLTQPFNALADRMGTATDRTHLPLLSALLLGLLGTLAPCQLTSNLAAVSYSARQVGHPRRVLATVLAYVGGKVTVYALIGIAIALLGLHIDRSPHFIPLVERVRKLMGPLLILAGLVMLDALPVHFVVGGRLSGWLEEHLPSGDLLNPYALGVAFSFAFCPTLFLLFFGLTLPLAVGTGLGIGVPIAFALGTAAPVLVLGFLVGAGGLSVRSVLSRIRRLDRWLSVAAGVTFILLGLNEFVLYWLI